MAMSGPILLKNPDLSPREKRGWLGRRMLPALKYVKFFIIIAKHCSLMTE